MAVSDQHLRVSDAERERVIDDLRQHTADGRLTMDEFEQRVAEALAARTRADLEPVLRELPALERAPQTPRRPRPRVALPSPRAVFTAVAIVLAVVLFTQGMWWIVFPLMGVLGGCGGRTRACSTRGASRDQAWSTGEPDDRELIRV